MERAEQLKKHLAENDPANKKKPSAMGANGKASNGKGGCVLMRFRNARDMDLQNPIATTQRVRMPTLRNSEVRSPEPF